MIRIAIDAMGGDFAPKEIIKGAVAAAREFSISVILVGDKVKVEAELKHYKNPTNISVVHASEVIGMDESPTGSVRTKKDSSINVAMNLLKDGKAEAVVSAGNTGALMASALFKLGRISGIERPAIATIFPTQKGEVLLLDMGANVDCKPQHLYQFAQMGSVYAERVMHVKDPKVGLLNIGEEAEKGNELTLAAYALIKTAPINFIGNVESKDILSGDADVIVCDGFVGNMILKFGESVSLMLFSLLKEEMDKHPVSKLGLFFMLPVLRNLMKRIDYDELGGALLLGVAGVCVKAHGRAKAKAIKNAIGVAAEAASEKIVERMSHLGK